MQQITNKDYDMVSELIRDFLEEMEFAPFGELPTAKNIVKELKRCKYFENGITAQQLGCAEASTQAVFIYFDESKPVEEQFKRIMGNPQEAGSPVECYFVIFVKTIEAKQKVEALKAGIMSQAKEWLRNRKEGSQKSKIRFCTLHAPMGAEKNFSVTIKSRIRALEYCPETVNAAKISSRVYVAKLFDIVALYNHIGTELFARNVRYHIADALNVESEIQETLEAYPEDFFNSNNGVAIQLKKREDLDTRDEYAVQLNYSQRGELSIINGAQTISAAADFFFQQAAEENTKRFIERAKRNAWVLLRVFYPENSACKDCGAMFDRISISLNRQKPISPMDIGYTCPAVNQINALYKQNRNNPYYFKLLKRGQDDLGRFQYQLADFGRMVKAYYYNEPSKARSDTTQNIIRYNEFSDDSSESENKMDTIYAPFGDYSTQEEKEKLFMTWYSPMNFAIEIARIYSQMEKQCRKDSDCEANKLAVLGNGKYFFVAYVVNMLNRTADSAAPSPSFENFHCDADKVKSVEDRVAKLVLQYADLAAQFAKKYLNTADPERNTLNSNDFKTQTLYEKWCAYAKVDADVLAWNAAMKAALDPDGGNEYETL